MSTYAVSPHPSAEAKGKAGRQRIWPAVVCYILGAACTLFGVFCFLIGDLKWGVFADQVATYTEAYDRFLETGRMMTFSQGFM